MQVKFASMRGGSQPQTCPDQTSSLHRPYPADVVDVSRGVHDAATGTAERPAVSGLRTTSVSHPGAHHKAPVWVQSNNREAVSSGVRGQISARRDLERWKHLFLREAAYDRDDSGHDATIDTLDQIKLMRTCTV